MVRCENPKCTHDQCIRNVIYGDMVLCWICYKRVPHKKRSEAIYTGKNQGIEDFLAPKEGAEQHE